MAGVIILDASVLIAHLDSSDDHHEGADRLLLDLADHELGASTLTLAEVFVAPARGGRLDVAASAMRALGVARHRSRSGRGRSPGRVPG